MYLSVLTKCFLSFIFPNFFGALKVASLVAGVMLPTFGSCHACAGYSLDGIVIVVSVSYHLTI